MGPGVSAAMGPAGLEAAVLPSPSASSKGATSTSSAPSSLASAMVVEGGVEDGVRMTEAKPREGAVVGFTVGAATAALRPACARPEHLIRVEVT